MPHHAALMVEPWRVPFARFLKEHAVVDLNNTRRYLYRVGRCLASAGPGADATDPALYA